MISPILKDYFQQRKQLKGFKSSVRNELTGIYARLLYVIFGLKNFNGTCDKEFILKFDDSIKDFNTDQRFKEHRATIAIFSKMNEERLQEYNSKNKSKKGGSLSIRKHSLPYLKSRIDLVRFIDRKTASKFLNILNSVDLYNELVEEDRWFYKKGFDFSAEERAFKILKSNQDNLRLTIINFLEQLVSNIRETISELE